jgi:predicted ATP-grasp superfamily ATP-dependent carboligase
VKFFLYEYVTGGGMLAASPPAVPTGSLLREGTAMIRALAEDVRKLPDTEAIVFRDVRLPGLSLPASHVVEIHDGEDECRALRRAAIESDWTLLIAPESGGALRERCRVVEAAGGRLLSPGTELIELATDKHRCVEHLRAAGVPVPPGRCLQRGQALPADFPYPAVLKPNDGAGSLGVQLVRGPKSPYDPTDLGTLARLERFCPGLAASVAVLCGPRDLVALPACRQRLTEDGLFGYLGGETPLPEPWAQRAERLAQAAVRALPAAIGYVGVDLVLGDRPDGSRDVVIEVNPRLTTSYVGLRRLVTANLPGAMVSLATGGSVELPCAPHCVQFDADGQVRIGGRE